MFLLNDSMDVQRGFLLHSDIDQEHKELLKKDVSLREAALGHQFYRNTSLLRGQEVSDQDTVKDQKWTN